MNLANRKITTFLTGVLLTLGICSTVTCCAPVVQATRLAEPHKAIETKAIEIKVPVTPQEPRGCTERPCVLRVPLDNSINTLSAEVFTADLAEAAKAGPDAILVQVSSGGGDLYAGWSIMRAIQDSPVPIHCLVDRHAYSMAFAILQVCQTRGAVRGSVLMMHQVHMGLDGWADQFGVEEHLHYVQALESGLERTCAHRLGMSQKAYAKRVKTEWWMDDAQALRFHALDYIVDGSPEAVRRLKKTLLEE